MRWLSGVFGVVALVGAFMIRSPLPESQTIYDQFLKNKLLLRNDVQQLIDVVQAKAPADSLRVVFKRSRLRYKHIEWLLEYYQPFLASRVNGPPISESEEYEPGQLLTLPSGLQVIETYLFADYDPQKAGELMLELQLLLRQIEQLEQGIPANRLTHSDILEAMRQEFFRLQTWSITGYDAPEARSGLAEASETLRVLQQVFEPYAVTLSEPLASHLKIQWQSTIHYVEAATDFDTFDRATFIREQLYPLCRLFQQARQALSVPVPVNRRFLSPMVATLSDSGAFRPDFLINFGAYATSPQKVALGRTLFFDPLLSGNNARSCASCHQPERAFTDGLVKSRAFQGRKPVLRNAPSLINAGLQTVQFYDSRVFFLEDQAHDVLGNDHEMHTSPEEIVQKLSASTEYKRLFAEAFSDGLTAANTRNALATYVRSLTRLNARPDLYLRGENVALSADERLGFNLFMGKARCATCHFFPIYNGFVPPHYEKTESEIIGVPKRAKTRNARIDPDLGRFNNHKKDIHRFAFKTPTVRNVALTAPYMHNGVYKTLEQVVDFYNRGGGRGIGIQLNDQTLSDEQLQLTPSEQKALIRFMQALTDTTGLTRKPTHLPAIDGNQTLTARKIGGTY